eukprot:755278-Hanusia_phi.AAC.3
MIERLHLPWRLLTLPQFNLKLQLSGQFDARTSFTKPLLLVCIPAQNHSASSRSTNILKDT